MNDPDQVTLIYHSGAGDGIGNTIAINADQRQYLVSNPNGKTPLGVKAEYIGSLKKYDFDQLNLYVCHAAVGKNNLAETILQTQNVKTVRASKNAVNFSLWNYHPRQSVRFVDYKKKNKDETK